MKLEKQLGILKVDEYFGLQKLEERLGLLKYRIDKEPHIKVDKSKCEKCPRKPCVNGCPAGCFAVINGELHFQYEDCIECGTCKIVCPFEAVDWNYPRGTYGVVYRYG
jgi:ferredoxin like protein